MKKHFFFPKKQYMFATINFLRGGNIRLHLFVAGFFYACILTICGVTPVLSINVPTASEVLINGSVTPFFCYQHKFLSEMINTEKNCNFATQSGAKARLHGTKSVESNAVERSSGKLKNREAAKLFRMAANAIANSPEELTGSLERSRYNCLFHVSAPDGTMFSINIHSREGGVI